MHGQESSRAEAAGAPLDASEVQALLARFGVASLRTRDEAEMIVLEELERRGHAARVVELRHGRLLLETSAAGARLLRYDEQHILQTLQLRLPGVVRELRLRVARRDEPVRSMPLSAPSEHLPRGNRA